MSVREEYFRCGSCKAFEVAYQDRMGRTMGQCSRKPRYGQVAAHDYACIDYRLDRLRLVPGAKVPDDADSTPRERERRRALEGATERMSRSRPATGSSGGGGRRLDPDDDAPKPKLQDIPLSLDPLSPDGDDAMDRAELKAILAEVLDETLGISDPPMQRRFRGGKVLIQPADPELAPKELEIDVLFRKVTAVRDKLRVLEQKVNATDAIDAEDKALLQGYVSSCYGSLKSFNFLFAEREDWFQN